MTAIIITVEHSDLTQTEIVREFTSDNKMSKPIVFFNIKSGYDFVKLQKHVYENHCNWKISHANSKTDKMQEEDLTLQFRAKSG